MAAEPALMSEDSELSYRFLESLPREQGHALDVEPLPLELPEEFEKRKNIRLVLRLIGGDSVGISGGMFVKFVRVEDNFQSGERGTRYRQSLIQRTKQWLDQFVADPEKAVASYEGMNLQTRYTDDQGETFLYCHLYFPDSVLKALRVYQIQMYEEVTRARRERVEEGLIREAGPSTGSREVRKETADVSVKAKGETVKAGPSARVATAGRSPQAVGEEAVPPRDQSLGYREAQDEQVLEMMRASREAGELGTEGEKGQYYYQDSRTRAEKIVAGQT